MDQTPEQQAKYFLAAIVESSQDSIVTVDFNNIITTWNKGAERLYGYRADEVVGKPLMMLTLPEDLKQVLANTEHVRNSEEVARFHTMRLHKDGHDLFLDILLSPVKNMAGEVVGVSTIARDATDRITALNAYRFQSQLLNTVNQAVVATDLEGHITYWNQQANVMYGWSADEVMGKKLQDFILPEALVAEGMEIMERVKEGEDWGGEFTVQRRDGTRFPVQVFDSPILNETGEVVGIIGAATDITERKRSEEKLRQRDEHLRLLMESVRDYAIFTTDLDRRVTSWNTGAEKTFGYTEEEMLGQSADLIFTPEDRAVGAPQQEADTALDHGRAADERWHLRKDGTRFYASGVMNVLHDGHVHGFVKVARDLTEQKKAQEALRESEERHRIVLEAAELCTWDWDVTGGSVMWNEQCRKLLGLPLDAGAPQNLEDFALFLHADDRERAQADVRAALTGADPYQSEFRIVRANDGSIRWLSGYGRAMSRDAGGKATRMTGVMYDITSRKEIEQRKDEFLGVASHELKTPLTAMKAYAEVLEDMMQEQPDLTAAAEVVRKLDDSIDRLDRLIRELLDATRLNEGRLELRKKPLDLVALVRECVEEAQRTTPTHRLEVEAENLPTISADGERIRQVLGNILSNAVKYSPAADRILVRLTNREGAVEVCVQDFGVGISDAASPRVFERFFRDPDPSLSTFPGLGLGLYIAREIVQLHGGELTVESRKGEGSTFCFSLPVAS